MGSAIAVKYNIKSRSLTPLNPFSHRKYPSCGSFERLSNVIWGKTSQGATVILNKSGGNWHAQIAKRVEKLSEGELAAIESSSSFQFDKTTELLSYNPNPDSDDLEIMLSGTDSIDFRETIEKLRLQTLANGEGIVADDALRHLDKAGIFYFMFPENIYPDRIRSLLYAASRPSLYRSERLLSSLGADIELFGMSDNKDASAPYSLRMFRQQKSKHFKNNFEDWTTGRLTLGIIGMTLGIGGGYFIDQHINPDMPIFAAFGGGLMAYKGFLGVQLLARIARFLNNPLTGGLLFKSKSDYIKDVSEKNRK